MAGLTEAADAFHVCEISDPYTHQLPMWARQLGLTDNPKRWLQEDLTRINPSGGTLSGTPQVISGLARTAEAALQLRGEAGKHQIAGTKRRSLTARQAQPVNITPSLCWRPKLTVRESGICRKAANGVLPSWGVDRPGPTAGAIHSRSLTSDRADGRWREPSDLHHSALSARSNRGDQPPGSFHDRRII